MFREIPGVMYDDPQIADADKARIESLEEVESAQLWDSYISSANRHFMCLDDTEWPASLASATDCFYRWQDDWNRNAPSEFADRLRSLDLAEDSTVSVFWMRELCVRTIWLVFVNNWINFLYEDEGCIVVAEESKTALVLSNGHAWVGNRQ